MIHDHDILQLKLVEGNDRDVVECSLAINENDTNQEKNFCYMWWLLEEIQKRVEYAKRPQLFLLNAEVCILYSLTVKTETDLYVHHAPSVP